MKKVSLFIVKLICLVVVLLTTQIFVVPKVLNSKWLIKYNLSNTPEEKTVIINKTEKVTVQENFSLRKTAERVAPSIVRIGVIPKLKQNKIISNYPSQNGVILSGDGIIVTTIFLDKVFNPTGDILKVELSDGQIFEASVLAKDMFNGLMFLKIDADNLPVAPFGESESMENGEKIIVGGQIPLEKKSLLGLNVIRYYDNNFNKEGVDFLFSDQNSKVLIPDKTIDSEFIGGPVIDFQGTMIGLVNSFDNKNTQIVPIANIKNSLSRLIATNEIEYPKLGVYYLNISQELANINNLSESSGALVYTPSGKMVTLVGSKGREIGLEYQDIITKINSEEITRQNSLSTILSHYKAGDKISIEVVRKNEKIKIDTVL